MNKVLFCRIEETKIFDIQFLHDCVNPTIAILHEDTHGRHVTTRELSLKDREFVKVIRYDKIIHMIEMSYFKCINI